MKPTQGILQFFVLQVVFMSRRIPSPSLYRSLMTSIVMIMFAITKALMSKQISHTKKISKLKQVKQLVWIICLAGTIFTANIFNLNNFIWSCVCYGKEYNRSSPSAQKLQLIRTITYATLMIIMCIFIWKNCFKQHLQTKVRFISLSINHIINCMVVCLTLIFSIFGQDTGNIGSAGPLITMILPNLSLVLVFTKAAFSVAKLNDIWSLEKMTSKELCCIPNLLFTIVFLLHFLLVLGAVFWSFVGDPYYG